MIVLRIIGIGSPSGDDQAGWLVARELQRMRLIERLPCRTSIIALDRPGVGLLQHLTGVDLLVLVDAMHSGAPPGTIHRIENLQCIEPDRSVSSHGMGVASALELGRALGALPPSVIVYAIECDSMMADSGPTGLVVAAASALAGTIARDLQQKFAVSACPGLAS